MSHSYPLKNLPAPIQLFIKPMLLISLGLHGLLLLVPTSSEENPILAKKEEAVKITQLPDAPSKPGDRSSKASSKAKSSSSRPRSVATPGPQGAETEELSSSGGGQVGRVSGTGEAGGGTPGTGEQSNDPWADFPHYPGARSGCLGKASCRQTTAELDQVAAHFKQQLPAKKYSVSPGPDEANRKVYQVSKAGKTQYLNLFPDLKGAVYILSSKPLKSPNEGIEVPDDLYITISQLNTQEADDSDFAAPNSFYVKGTSEDQRSLIPAEPSPGIDGTPKLVPNQIPSQVYSNLLPKLQSSGLKVSKVGNHGLGDLYKVQKGTATGYLNLVPTKDRKGTIMVVWLYSPMK